MTIDRNELRRDMRKARRRVTPAQRAHAAKRFALHIARRFLLKPGMHVAVYHAYGSEADASGLIKLARKRGCTVYLPVILHVRHSRMEFARFDPGAALTSSVFGIPEPQRHPRGRIRARRLDLIFLPLVAFDANGWRLGSGAGFYDRHLSHLRIGRRWRRPKLIGVAYEFQRVAALQPHRWDIPMDAVVTERCLHQVRFASEEAP